MDSIIDSQLYTPRKLDNRFSTLAVSDAINGCSLPDSNSDASASHHPQKSALQPFELPPTVKAPTKTLKSWPSQEAGSCAAFFLFADLPTETRLRIWQLMLPKPEVLTVLYDINSLAGEIDIHCNEQRYKGTWEFSNVLTTRPAFVGGICQESRYEALRCGRHRDHKLIYMTHNVTQRRWFNFDTDTLFLTTNARGYIMDDERVVAPDSLPVDVEKVQRLAIGWGLWEDWDFAENFGENVTCEECWGVDNSQEEWKEDVFRDLKKARKVQIAINSDELNNSDASEITGLNFVKPSTTRQYSLMQKALEEEFRILKKRTRQDFKTSKKYWEERVARDHRHWTLERQQWYANPHEYSGDVEIVELKVDLKRP